MSTKTSQPEQHRNREEKAAGTWVNMDHHECWHRRNGKTCPTFLNFQASWQKGRTMSQKKNSKTTGIIFLAVKQVKGFSVDNLIKTCKTESAWIHRQHGNWGIRHVTIDNATNKANKHWSTRRNKAKWQ